MNLLRGFWHMLEIALGWFGGKFNRLQTLEKRMAQIDDDLAAIQASQQQISGALDGLSDDVAALKATITVLEGQIGGGLTPDQQAALSAVRQAAEGLATRAAGLDALTASNPPVVP